MAGKTSPSWSRGAFKLYKCLVSFDCFWSGPALSTKKCTNTENIHWIDYFIFYSTVQILVFPMEKLTCLSADFKGIQFYVPCDFDVTDDVSVFTVRELHLVAIGKFYFKHVSNQFHLNLNKKNIFVKKYNIPDKSIHSIFFCFRFLTLTSAPLSRGFCISRFSSPQHPAAFELQTITDPSASSLNRGLKCRAIWSSSQPRSIWNLSAFSWKQKCANYGSWCKKSTTSSSKNAVHGRKHARCVWMAHLSASCRMNNFTLSWSPALRLAFFNSSCWEEQHRQGFGVSLIVYQSSFKRLRYFYVKGRSQDWEWVKPTMFILNHRRRVTEVMKEGQVWAHSPRSCRTRYVFVMVHCKNAYIKWNETKAFQEEAENIDSALLNCTDGQLILKLRQISSAMCDFLVTHWLF